MGTRKRFRLLGVTAIGALLACLAGVASAGIPNDAVLVEEIQPAGAGSTPEELTVVGNKVFFSAVGSGVGRELWVSDGTEAGTQFVKDINPAGGSADSNPTELTNVGGTLFFQAEDGANHPTSNRELWKSDGTEAGTVMVKDINPNPASAEVTDLTNVNGTLFFVARDPVVGRELFKSDGTPGGTVNVSNIAPEPGPGDSTPQELAAVGNTLYFSADPMGFGDRELYKSDGTGVAFIEDINPGGNSDPEEITDVNGVAFFRANDGTNGAELWKANATGTDATLVENLNPAAAAGFPASLTAIGSTIYFSATDGVTGSELYRSDGSGIDIVKDIRQPNPGQSSPVNLANVGGTLYFAADDAGNNEELWRSDGTEAGTALVKDINPSGNGFPSDLTNIDGMLYFTAQETTNGPEHWRSDGTTAGTVPIEDIEPGTGGSVSNPMDFVGLGGAVYFPAFQTGSGLELWKAVDTIPPTVTIAAGPTEGETLTSGSPIFGFDSDDLPATFGCRLYAAGQTPPAFGACSGPGASHTPSTPLADGAYTFDVQGSDQALNSATATRNFAVDLPATTPDPDPDPVNPAPSARCTAARADLKSAETKLTKAKAALKKAKKSKKKAKIKKAKAKVKKANDAVKDAKAEVADLC